MRSLIQSTRFESVPLTASEFFRPRRLNMRFRNTPALACLFADALSINHGRQTSRTRNLVNATDRIFVLIFAAEPATVCAVLNTYIWRSRHSFECDFWRQNSCNPHVTKGNSCRFFERLTAPPAPSKLL